MFTNAEINKILYKLNKEYNTTEFDYVYSLYDDTYENRPLNPTNISIITPRNININDIKQLLKNYNITTEIIYGIGESINIKQINPINNITQITGIQKI